MLVALVALGLTLAALGPRPALSLVWVPLTALVTVGMVHTSLTLAQVLLASPGNGPTTLAQTVMVARLWLTTLNSLVPLAVLDPPTVITTVPHRAGLMYQPRSLRNSGATLTPLSPTRANSGSVDTMVMPYRVSLNTANT